MPPSLAPSPRASSGSSTPSPSSFAGSTLDLRSLATGSYRALTQALNLSPTSAPGAELAPGEAPAKARWASVRALRVRFRPAALDGADGELNAWVLGMGELALGRSREWDPRGVDFVGGGGRVRSKGGTDSAWPVLSTSMGSPPCVEVVFWDGRTSEVDPTGLAQDEVRQPSGAELRWVWRQAVSERAGSSYPTDSACNRCRSCVPSSSPPTRLEGPASPLRRGLASTSWNQDGSQRRSHH